MALSLYSGKILVGGAVAVIGTGGVVVCVKNPEWFTGSKTSQNEQSTITSWMTVLGLEEICKNSESSKTCTLQEAQIKQLGFVVWNNK